MSGLDRLAARWPRGWWSTAVLLGAILAAAVVVALRHVGGNVLDSLWAEDGGVFLRQAHERGPLAVVLEPYVGYLHVPSRLAAALASVLPLDAAAAVMSGTAIVAVAALAVFVFVATRGVLVSPVLRLVLASAVVLTPVARIESLDSMSNLHFTLLFAAFWALLGDLRGWTAVAGSLVVAGAALSDPLAVLLVPVGAWRLLAGPPPASRAPFVVGALCLVVQLAAMAASASSSLRDRDPDALTIALGYPLRVVGGLVLGLDWSAAVWTAWGHLPTAIAGAILLAVVVAVVRQRGTRRAHAALALGTSVVAYGAAMWLRFDAGYFPSAAGDDQFLRDGVRYLLVPILLLLGAIVVLIDGGSPRTTPGTAPPGLGSSAATVLAVALVAIVGATSFNDFARPDRRTRAPTWAAALADARATCREGAERVEIPIAPRGWEVSLPCAVVAR